jgi:hypothetical protein
MKKSIVLKLFATALLLACFSLTAMASTNPHAGEDQLFQFKFRMKGELYEYSQKSSTYEEAYERAAKACFQHFKAGRHVSEDQGLDIIDVCANPRST